VSWSAQQLRWLHALGHEPMLLASSLRVGAAFGREEPRLAGESRPKAAPTGALAAALARAAGGRDLAALALDLDGLRREPALKRALWPTLRAMRRGH
jgi:hypothetical protein